MCDLFFPHVIKPFLYLHCAHCSTANSPFFHVGTLLSLRENPFPNCCRPPLRSTLIILQAESERASRRQNAGWGPTTSTRCSSTSGLNQSSGSSVQMEQRGGAVGRPGNMIKDPAAWLRSSSCEWNNRERPSLVLNSPDGGETSVCGGEESEALPCDREKIKDRR